VLLLAGPGTGKTHTLALRVKWLVEEEGIDPNTITLITFTKEAARNMRERLSDPEKQDVYLEPGYQPRTICTMHSLGQEIIGHNPGCCGLQEGFRVENSKKIRPILFEDAAQLLGHPRSLGREADLAKQRGTLVDAPSELRSINAQYDRILRACNAIDHDDQIILACQLLRQNEELLRKYQEQACHLLVDEYQDINAAQYEMIRLLSAATPEGLYAVGDDDQSIYGFRGGSPAYMRSFEADFGPSAQVRALDLSRRCPFAVLHSALAVVDRFNADRLPKPVPQFARKDPGKVIIHDVPSDVKEAEIVSAICREASSSRSVLILIPSSPFAPTLRRSLRRAGIGFEFKGSVAEGGWGAFEVIHGWLSNPSDNLELRLLLQMIIDGGTTGVPSTRSRRPEKLLEREEALKSIARLWTVVLERSLPLQDALAAAIPHSDLLKQLSDCLLELAGSFDGAIEQFAETACRIIKPWKSPKAMLEEVQMQLDELRGRGGTSTTGDVRMMSMRMAKGLEADITVVVGLDELVLPNEQRDDIPETARLAFVSMTRAKSELHLFHARTRDARATYLKDSYQLQPSRFLKVIPKEYSESKYVQSAAAAAKSKKQAKVH